MERQKNTLKQLMEAFSCPDRPVTPAEFRTFWSSLTEQEKEYYNYAPLS